MTTGRGIFNPVFIFDVGVPSFLLEKVVTYVLLNPIVVFVLDVFDYELVPAETFTTDLTLKFLVVNALAIINAVLSFKLLEH